MFSKSKLFVWMLVFFCFLLTAFSVKNFLFKPLVPLELGALNDKSDTSIISQEPIVQSPIKSVAYFTGDIMLGRDVENHLQKFGSKYPYKNIVFDDKLAYVVGNFESPIPEVHVQAPNNTFRFSVNADFIPALREAGFTHLSLANNHAFDYGLAGYNSTLIKLRENGFIPFGHPSVLATSSFSIMTLNNKRVAIIGIHTLFNYPVETTLKNLLTEATAVSEIQIVYIHWGDEYNELQSKSQRELATILAEAGADVIIGHHPHVVQGIEKINETLVFYSLGNYIFDQYFSNQVQTGLVLKLSADDTIRMELIPVTSIGTKAQPRILEGIDKENFLQKLTERSDKDLMAEIAAGKLPLTLALASSTEVAIMAE